ncbi:MAG: patatin-like phospholipase family protein [Lysobacterales bacterium]
MESPSRRSELLARVAHLPLFAGLDRRSLVRVADELEWIALPGGAELFRESDPPDAVYVLIAGCLGAFRGLDARLQLVGRIHPGETVGEMALLSGHPRTATVRALRDSEIVRFSLQAFERLARAQPEAMLAVARIAVERLERTLQGGRQEAPPRTLALLPAHDGIDLDAMVERLGTALGRFGEAVVVDAEHFLEASIGELHALEAEHAFVLYVGSYGQSAWNERCRRQADQLLLIANATRAPSSLSIDVPQCEGAQTVALALLQPGRIIPGAARAWRQRLQVEQHFHLRDLADIDRLARQLARRSVGVVFSGGGARGFAHIGVIRALREAGLSIDAVGGTSIGALMAAAVALEWEDETLYQTFHRSFVSSNPLSDYTLPLVALVAGRKASRLLRREFGEGDIEDLPLPFYCVSADLARGGAVIHEQGSLWHALRASIAIPGVLPPVSSAGRVLVDGGVIDNLPVETMRKRNAGPIIGIDIAGEHALVSELDETDLPPLWQMLTRRWRGGPRRPGILRILLRAGMVNSAGAAAQNAAISDLMLKPPVDSIDLLAWDRFADAIESGYAYTRDRLALGLPFG